MNPVVLSENDRQDEYDSSDNVPLASLKQNDLGLRKSSSDCDLVSVFDDSDADPTYSPPCEFRNCKDEVFSTCHKCLALLCWNHFKQEDNMSCENHGTLSKPEDFKTEGVEKEGTHEKTTRVNKKKLAKVLRNLGKEYKSPSTNKTIHARKLLSTCNVDYCKKIGKECFKFTDDLRDEICKQYWNMGSLQRQREFIVHHTEVTETKQKTTNNKVSRRQKSFRYYLTIDKNRILVCKTLFLHTLSISERALRSSISKINEMGIVETEKRGGRKSEKVKDRDKRIHAAIEHHIERFPRVESHYCRSSSSREYLHPELSLPKMYAMFLSEWPTDDKPSFSTYTRIFKTKNLSFFTPKKDQCTLCMTYKDGNDSVKAKLKDRYDLHTAEKIKVRQIKNKCKLKSKSDATYLCGVFDLQQVMHLPISKESALFYKRRLANYNLTFYNMATKDCDCFCWHENLSKRGSSEIATAIYNVLELYDEKGVQFVTLFADGCCGQNKNSIMATMLLYAVNNSNNITSISLRFFESFHGQNEGDSCHSAISSAVKHAGDLFVPSQLYPIYQLARKKQPYIVHALNYSDFFDFKKLSKDLRVLSVRSTDAGDNINWKSVMEIRVIKNAPLQIFFKTSHLEMIYKSITLKRQKQELKDTQLLKLNNGPQVISKEKYNDLISLCQGDTPIIRLDEHKRFYESLPH